MQTAADMNRPINQRMFARGVEESLLTYGRAVIVTNVYAASSTSRYLLYLPRLGLILT